MKTKSKKTKTKVAKSIYLDAPNAEYIRTLVDEKNYKSENECICSIITKHRMGTDPALESAEEKISATIRETTKRQARDLRRMQLTCDALDALLQVLTRMLLLNIPEPPADVKAALRATSESRYDTLMKLTHKQYEKNINERKELESTAE
jgi:hypothetical protein